MSVSDALSTTSSGQVFATKWPRAYKTVVPHRDDGQSLQQAFLWAEKAKANLEKLKLEVKPGEKPALLSNATFAVSSNFSGICSASRGARVLEAHGFGCQFRHVHLSASHVFLSG